MVWSVWERFGRIDRLSDAEEMYYIQHISYSVIHGYVEAIEREIEQTHV